MGQSTRKSLRVHMGGLVLVGLALVTLGLFTPSSIIAAELTERSITLSDATAAQNNVTYNVAFRIGSTAMIGSVRVQFCANTPLVDDVCAPPAGFDATNAVLTAQSGATGFTISSSSTANDIILSRPPAIQAPVNANYTFTNITNPLNDGSIFGRLTTYPTSDGSGSYSDGGGVAMYFRPSFVVSAEVPPFLRFCVGESIADFDCTTATDPFSNLGLLGPSVTGLAQSQMLAATNVEGGFSLWVVGTTMTSGNNVLPAMNDEPSQPGVSQFGINLRANTNPIVGQDAVGPGIATISSGYNQANQFRFNSGDVLITANAPADYIKYTVSYVVNVNPDQPGGLYATTLTYVALVNF